jgi:anti-repressor protein
MTSPPTGGSGGSDGGSTGPGRGGQSTTVAAFRAPEGPEIRVVTIDGEPWFVAADVCAALGIANSRDAVSRLDEAEKGVGETDTLGGLQRVTIVSEPGLYRLVMRSNRPDAVRFQMWIAHEVLPTIRRAGSYATAPALPQTYADALRQLATSVEEREALTAQVAELAPAASSWATLATGYGDYSVADAAKVLSRDPAINVGQQRLFTLLGRLGWIYRAGDQRWRVYQTAVEAGRLSELATSHYHPRTGELIVDPPQVRITVKGLGALHRHLAGEAPLAIETPRTPVAAAGAVPAAGQRAPRAGGS